MIMNGVWIPLVTPFLNGELDLHSYKRLIEYYLQFDISGFIPMGTTGEAPTLTEYEFEQIINKTLEYTDNKIPVFVGLGGNNTKKIITKLKDIEKSGVDGILSVAPYYNKPDQRGIYEHFKSIANSTSLLITIYNIPYRTGINIENETIHKLAKINNIIALKDCSGNIKQSLNLLENPPPNFNILTGDDNLYYTTLVNGGSGGILASAQIDTEKYIRIFNLIQDNNHTSAFNIWKEISPLIPRLFQEPNPAPIKYCLKHLGIITSDEVRLPLLGVSNELKNILDKELNQLLCFN